VERAIDFLGGRTMSKGAEVFGKGLDAVAGAAGGLIGALGDGFGATALTPERIEAMQADAKAAKVKGAQRAEDQKIDMQRFRADAEYRRQVEQREAEKLAQEQRRYYEQQQERERQR